ncbi:TIGR03619 family F420-dependent LLM class oxidoreductase [Kitasatospora sp. NPDC006697]|uniref:TIGR03619 family F420-dependent LLM class oxidoreductase n=1 Tax=Kitasatospora sp. NPDC006697 TaxID=3364020 RepID=UPI0036BB1496
MHIGLSIPQYGRFADPELAAEVSASAELIGYDSLWVGDRLLVAAAPRSRYPGGDGTAPAEQQVFLDPLTILTVAATATSRVRLGSSALNALWQPPVLLARTLTTLDRVSGGRLDVGLGLGWSRDEYQAAGVPWAGRGARLEETLDVLERVWAEGDLVEHQGAVWTVPPSVVRPKPVQRPRPPLLLGGFSAATLARVGRRADGWLGAALPVPVLRQMWRSVQQHAEQAGRDPEALRLVVRVNPVLTAEPAPENQVPQRGTFGQLLGYLTHLVGALGAELLVDLHYAAGDAEEYLALAGDLHDALRKEAGR